MAKKDDAVVKFNGGGALALPDFAKAGGVRGREAKAEREDLVMPRLALAQGLSPEIEEGNAKYIDGLKVGDAFNTLTGQIYGKEPLEVVIVRRDPARFVEFNPREEGGGIKDFNVTAGDPRTKFGPNGEKPAATKFLEYVALIGPGREPIALSFKGAGLKTAKLLNGLLDIRNADSFTSKFFLTSSKESNDKGTFYIFNVRFGGNVDEETYHYAEAIYESIKDRTVVIDRDETEESDTSDANVPF